MLNLDNNDKATKIVFHPGILNQFYLLGRADFFQLPLAGYSKMPTSQEQNEINSNTLNVTKEMESLTTYFWCTFGGSNLNDVFPLETTIYNAMQ
jgi:hypothetical protein